MKRKLLYLLPFALYACAPVSDQQTLEQRVSELELRVARLEEKQKEDERRFQEINRRLDLLAQKVGRKKLEEEVLKEEEERPPAAVEKEEKEVSDEVEASYKEALELYNMKRLYEARDAFIEFLKKYEPNKYTDNAYFWLGKIYYELGNKERARQLFQVLIKKCEEGQLPDCNKLPDAYFMLMKMALDEGNLEEANRYMSILEEKFPEAEATKRAKEILYKQP